MRLSLAGCDQIRIGSPDSLWLLWLVPALAVFFVYSFSTRTRLLRRFASPAMLARLTAGVSRPRQLFKAALIALAALAAVLAVAELKYGFTWEEVQRRGVDIVVALDVSDSMLVEDAEAGGKLSRLERAKREIADLLRIVGGDRIGLVAFAGTAFLECPLTLDYGAAHLFLASIDTDLIPVKGTALGAALRTSLEAFEGGSHSSRAIILITDGEDHGGDALAAAEEAKLAGVRIFAIGIGRDEGAPIPAPGGGFRRDRRGEMVLSRLDEPTLQRIALATGGRYVRSVTGDVDLEQIYSQGIKAVLEDQELESQRRQRWEDRFQWLLGLALIALMVEPLIAERRRRTGTGGESGGAAAARSVRLGRRPQQPPRRPSRRPPPRARPAGGRSVGGRASRRRAATAIPGEAYEAGAYDQAVQGFIDRQVEQPDEPGLALNLGSAYYGMRDYEQADQALAGRRWPPIRRCASRRSTTWATRPTVRGGWKRPWRSTSRRSSSTPTTRTPSSTSSSCATRSAGGSRRTRSARSSNSNSSRAAISNSRISRQQDGQQPQDQGSPDSQEGDGQQQQPQGAPEQPSDSDGDGLPDEVERQGANPTDPENPDSDGDGLPDGAEDRNASGGVDPGETDPNKVDSDGDGVPDSQEAAASEAAEAAEADRRARTV